MLLLALPAWLAAAQVPRASSASASPTAADAALASLDRGLAAARADSQQQLRHLTEQGRASPTSTSTPSNTFAASPTSADGDRARALDANPTHGPNHAGGHGPVVHPPRLPAGANPPRLPAARLPVGSAAAARQPGASSAAARLGGAGSPDP